MSLEQIDSKEVTSLDDDHPLFRMNKIVLALMCDTPDSSFAIFGKGMEAVGPAQQLVHQERCRPRPLSRLPEKDRVLFLAELVKIERLAGEALKHAQGRAQELKEFTTRVSGLQEEALKLYDQFSQVK